MNHAQKVHSRLFAVVVFFVQSRFSDIPLDSLDIPESTTKQRDYQSVLPSILSPEEIEQDRNENGLEERKKERKERIKCGRRHCVKKKFRTRVCVRVLLFLLICFAMHCIALLCSFEISILCLIVYVCRYFTYPNTFLNGRIYIYAMGQNYDGMAKHETKSI